jgi:2-oxoglutarate dehydrogenase E1 component
MAELLAYAAVLRGGKPVRLSGQDSVRGTFSHRHAAVLYKNGKGMHTPLKHLFEGQPNFSVFNSPLSEYGVMGFEYGYALGNPQSLVIWEAQFGDFNNVAQPIIDQYIVAAEDKWGMLNDLVLFLPHGYEGQGAEHSSARIERFLQLAVDGNICVAQPTTPANLYHLLVDQAGDRKRPLIVFTPKSLLRHPKVVSTLEELGSGAFEKIRYPLNFEANDMSRIVLTSGKLYYDLIEKQEELGIKNTLLISVEQLHPFPIEKIESIMSSCVNVNEIIWAQEEPMNMGAWSYIMQELYQYKLRVVARPASGSPAVGLNSQHKIQQQKLIDKSFGICDCERQNVFCNLQCSRISKPKDL